MRRYSQTKIAVSLRSLHARRVARGVCVVCETPHNTGKRQCRECLDTKAAYVRERYHQAKAAP